MKMFVKCNATGEKFLPSECESFLDGWICPNGNEGHTIFVMIKRPH